jgi:hypothetical protein
MVIFSFFKQDVEEAPSSYTTRLNTNYIIIPWFWLVCSDSDLILKLIISLVILWNTLKAASIQCKASRNEENKTVKNENSDSKESF